MAVKITRQPKKIALLGAATSAAALRAGHERAPAALRAAGLIDRLTTAGFTVNDLGDTATYSFQIDDEHPRARNVPAILKSLNDLRPRVELAVKSGALPLILSGDSISVLAIIAGARRYYRNVSLIYMDRDAGLHQPATTPTGCVDGMVVAHVIGLGAPELIRFWGEPPLVRKPDVALFGFERLHPTEEQYLTSSPLRRYPASEVSAAPSAQAKTALERVHVANHQFVLHIDLDVISDREFRATNSPGEGGLSLDNVREALRVFASQPNLAAVEVSGYNPDLDPDGEAARQLIDLLVDVLAARLGTGPVAENATADAAQDVAANAAGDASANAADAAPQQAAVSLPLGEPPLAEPPITESEAGKDPAASAQESSESESDAEPDTASDAPGTTTS